MIYSGVMEMFENATHKKWYMVLQIRKNEQKIVYIHELQSLSERRFSIIYQRCTKLWIPCNFLIIIKSFLSCIFLQSSVASLLWSLYIHYDFWYSFSGIYFYVSRKLSEQWNTSYWYCKALRAKKEGRRIATSVFGE